MSGWRFCAPPPNMSRKEKSHQLVMEMTHILKAPVMILARNSKTSSKHNQTSPWRRHARTVSSLQPFLGSPATVLQSKLFTADLREVNVQQCFTSTNNAWHGQRWTQFCVHMFQQTSKVIRFSSKMWRFPKLVMDDHSTETLWRLGDPPARNNHRHGPGVTGAKSYLRPATWRETLFDVAVLQC